MTLRTAAILSTGLLLMAAAVVFFGCSAHGRAVEVRGTASPEWEHYKIFEGDCREVWSQGEWWYQCVPEGGRRPTP